MSQATEWGVPTSGPANPVEVATRMQGSLDAQLSLHSGTSAPTYAVKGTGWLDTTSATEHAVKQYDGAQWITLYTFNPETHVLGTTKRVVVFATPGVSTWTKPDGCRAVRVRVQGGGGGSDGVPATSGTQTAWANGGAGGGYSEKLILADSLGAAETVTVGAGGAAGSAGSSSGGTSSFGSHCSATGGSKGSQAGPSSGTPWVSNASPAVGGAGTGGDINIPGQRGGLGMALSNAAVVGGAGGNSPFGFGHPAITVTSSGAGNNGYGYGSGAAGGANGISQAGNVGATGQPGIVIVEEYY
ncbi:glycine-rich domain-containing protein [Microvirga roseola]|uniref:glycine-rich domain-containing protein n=1 Tax=Microvirga roseola TaxID=2883126 RepID=UPI001E4814D7|nr:hypothetical protein [Microvirga roseola]